MRVRTKAAIVLSSQALSALVAYGSVVVIGRFFLPASYGAYAYAFGLTTLLLLLSDIGLTTVHQRNIAMGHAVGPSLGVLLRIRLVLLIALVLGSLVVLVLLPGLASRALHATTLGVLAWVIAIQAVTIARSFIETTWQAQQRVHLVEALRILDAGISVAVLANAGLLLAAVQGWTPPLVAVGETWARLLHVTGPLSVEQGAMLIAGSYTAAKLACLGVGLWWARREDWRLGPWDGVLARQFLRLAIPLSIVSLLAVVTNSLDVVAVGLFWDAREVAFYGMAQRLGMVGLLIGISVASVLFPRYAQLHALGDKEGLDSTFRAAQRFLLLVAAPVAAAMLAMTPQGLYATAGPAYNASIAPLRWLAAWAFVMTLSSVIQTRVMAEGRLRPLLMVAALGAALDLVLNLLLVPPSLGGLGANGAAATTFASGVACYAYLRLWSHRTHGTALWGVHLWRVLAAAAVTGLLWWSAGRLFPATLLDHAWELLVAGILGLFAYAGFLVLLGELGREDWSVLRRLVRPRSWLDPREE